MTLGGMISAVWQLKGIRFPAVIVQAFSYPLKTSAESKVQRSRAEGAERLRMQFVNFLSLSPAQL